MLVLIGLLVLAGEGALRGRGGRVTRAGPMAQRVTPPQRLGRMRWPVLALFAALIVLALGVPVASTLYWMAAGLPPALSGGANVSLLDAAAHTAGYSGAAGVLATVLAVPVALLAVRHAGRVRPSSSAAPTSSRACPAWWSRWPWPTSPSAIWPGSVYQTAALLVVCYAIMFFPLALVGVRASLAQAPAGLDEVARSLGQGRARRAVPGHAAAARRPASSPRSAWSSCPWSPS